MEEKGEEGEGGRRDEVETDGRERKKGKEGRRGGGGDLMIAYN